MPRRSPLLTEGKWRARFPPLARRPARCSGSLPRRPIGIAKALAAGPQPGRSRAVTANRADPRQAATDPTSDGYSRHRLPSGSAGEEAWSAFKRRAFDEFIELIRQTDRALGQNRGARLERIHELRREHHLIVVADRIRRSSSPPETLSAEQLREAAEFVVDRCCRGGGAQAAPRSSLERRMISSARVNWHKIMRRAESSAHPTADWGAGRRELRGSTAIFRKITAPGLAHSARADMLGKHIAERLRQLVHLAREVAAATATPLPDEQARIVADLERLLDRTRPRSGGDR